MIYNIRRTDETLQVENVERRSASTNGEIEMKDKNRTVIASIFVQEDPRVVGEPSLEIIAGEYLALHNEKIIEWHELSDDTDLEFFNRATQSNPGEDNGMGERVYEISGEDSYSGNPILFEVPASLLGV